MLYVGYAIQIQEALRLLRLNDSYATSFYDTQGISAYLMQKRSRIVFNYIDKGACLFGVRCQLESCSTVTDTLKAILEAKIRFEDEVKKLGVDTSVVNLTWIEEDETPTENPEPRVISL